MTTESPRDDEIFPKRRRAISISLIFALLLGCSPLVLGGLVGIWSYSPDEATSDLASYLSYLMCFGCFSPIFFQLATETSKSGDRSYEWVSLGRLASLIFLVCTLLMYRTMRFGPNNERHQAMVHIANNSQPLIAAIEQFAHDHDGKPPQTLNQLVPDYLVAVPTTGVARYDKYQYQVNSAPMGTPGPVSRYVLQVYTIEFGKWDSMTYLPDQNYDQMKPASAFDSIPMTGGRKWVYFNE